VLAFTLALGQTLQPYAKKPKARRTQQQKRTSALTDFFSKGHTMATKKRKTTTKRKTTSTKTPKRSKVTGRFLKK
jgi:hypothetical protein